MSRAASFAAGVVVGAVLAWPVAVRSTWFAADVRAVIARAVGYMEGFRAAEERWPILTRVGTSGSGKSEAARLIADVNRPASQERTRRHRR